MTPRVAYFPDSFHEINGVAHTSRNFVAYAERHGLPFLCVRAGERGEAISQHGEVQTLELKRSSLSMKIEHDLEFDPIYFRYGNLIGQTLLNFRPDLIHITGPSELGMLGAYFAHKLSIPLVASWHTNVHEYLARRMQKVTRLLGSSGEVIGKGIETGTLEAMLRLYRLAKVLYAPNPELCTLLEDKIGRPCHLMQRGVETEMFSPARRTRAANDGRIVLGYVGRLSVEKNVALLPKIDVALRAQGIVAEWVIIGQGVEEEALRRDLPSANFRGVLRGEVLAEAYADMDLLVFPSHTDTFGNVVLEALASGVPAVVSPDGGPATIVQDGVTGIVATDEDCASAVAVLLGNAELRATMGVAARAYALTCSWDAVFDRVYAQYPVIERVNA